MTRSPGIVFGTCIFFWTCSKYRMEADLGLSTFFYTCRIRKPHKGLATGSNPWRVPARWSLGQVICKCSMNKFVFLLDSFQTTMERGEFDNPQVPGIQWLLIFKRRIFGVITHLTFDPSTSWDIQIAQVTVESMYCRYGMQSDGRSQQLGWRYSQGSRLRSRFVVIGME